MDIKKWLQQTVDEDVDLDYEIAQREEPKPALIKVKRPRHAPATLIPSSPALRPEKKATKERRRQHARKASSVQSITSASASEESASVSTESSSSSSSAESEQFERRKRHKTRNDLYEPNSGARKRRTRKKEQDEDEEAKRKKKRKKHHRTEKKKKSKRAEKPGQNLINNFSAKNVQSDRLTLQPGATLGLFRKGRASSPVKGRGLPDLVFSEMKFLQKPRQVHRDVAAPELPSKDQKKRSKRKQTEDEEVSAFFAEHRTVLAAKDANRKTSSASAPPRSSKTPSAVHAQASSHVVLPSVEVSVDRRKVQSARSSTRTPLIPWSTSPDRTVPAPGPNINVQSLTVGQLNRERAKTEQRHEDIAAMDLPPGTMSAEAPQATANSQPVSIDKHKTLQNSNPDLRKQDAPRTEYEQHESQPTTVNTMAAAVKVPATAQRQSSPMSKLLSACQHSIRHQESQEDAYRSPASVVNTAVRYQERSYANPRAEHVDVRIETQSKDLVPELSYQPDRHLQEQHERPPRREHYREYVTHDAHRLPDAFHHAMPGFYSTHLQDEPDRHFNYDMYERQGNPREQQMRDYHDDTHVDMDMADHYNPHWVYEGGLYHDGPVNSMQDMQDRYPVIQQQQYQYDRHTGNHEQQLYVPGEYGYRDDNLDEHENIPIDGYGNDAIDEYDDFDQRLEQQADEILANDLQESDVVPGGFWRPRRLY